MRFAVLALVGLLVPQASAFDGALEVTNWYGAQRGCYQMEDNSGRPVSPATSDLLCHYRDLLTAELKQNGYCFDKSEQEWALCAVTVPLYGATPQK